MPRPEAELGPLLRPAGPRRLDTIVLEEDDDYSDAASSKAQHETTMLYGSLPREEEEKLPHAIVSIQVDPSNLIIACSYSGEIVALTPYERRHHYYYLELGEDMFCTVGLPQTQTKHVGGDVIDLEQNTAMCCM